MPASWMLRHCYSKCGSWTSSVCITWVLVSSAPQPPFQIWHQNMPFNKILGICIHIKIWEALCKLTWKRGQIWVGPGKTAVLSHWCEGSLGWCGEGNLCAARWSRWMIKTGKGKVGRVSQQGTVMWRWTIWEHFHGASQQAWSGGETCEVKARAGGWEMQLVKDKKRERNNCGVWKKPMLGN